MPIARKDNRYVQILRRIADQSHYTVEAVPDRAMTYKEGIANTINVLIDPNSREQYFQWFASNGEIMVEREILPENGGANQSHLSPDLWLYNQLIRAGAQPIPMPPHLAADPSAAARLAGYAFFRVRDIPAKFIMHNEFVQAMICAEYCRYRGFNRYMTAVRAADQQLNRVSASGVAILFEKLCSAELPSGATPASLASAPGGRATAQPYLLPLALADYFTGYRSNSKDDFKQMFENSLPQDWVDLYWNAKDAVRTAVPIRATPTRDDLSTIAAALGVTTSPNH